MTEASAPTPAPPKERRLRWLLIASLALNLLIIGAIGGSIVAWKRHHPGIGGSRGEDYGLLGFANTLQRDRRKEIAKEIRAEREKMRPLWLEMHEARRAAVDVMASDAYDPAKLKAALDRITEAETKLKTAGLAIFLKTAEALTPDERMALAEWWRKKRSRHFRFGDRRGPPAAPDDTPPPDKDDAPPR